MPGVLLRVVTFSICESPRENICSWQQLTVSSFDLPMKKCPDHCVRSCGDSSMAHSVQRCCSRARTAGFTADGLYEEAAPGGDWVTKCLLCTSQHTLCQFESHSKICPSCSGSVLVCHREFDFREDRDVLVCALELTIEVIKTQNTMCLFHPFSKERNGNGPSNSWAQPSKQWLGSHGFHCPW